jgi:hypothetical protein
MSFSPYDYLIPFEKSLGIDFRKVGKISMVMGWDAKATYYYPEDKHFYQYYPQREQWDKLPLDDIPKYQAIIASNLEFYDHFIAGDSTGYIYVYAPVPERLDIAYYNGLIREIIDSSQGGQDFPKIIQVNTPQYGDLTTIQSDPNPIPAVGYPIRIPRIEKGTLFVSQVDDPRTLIMDQIESINGVNIHGSLYQEVEHLYTCDICHQKMDIKVGYYCYTCHKNVCVMCYPSALECQRSHYIQVGTDRYPIQCDPDDCQTVVPKEQINCTYYQNNPKPFVIFRPRYTEVEKSYDACLGCYLRHPRSDLTYVEGACGFGSLRDWRQLLFESDHYVIRSNLRPILDYHQHVLLVNLNPKSPWFQKIAFASCGEGKLRIWVDFNYQ